MVTIKSYTTLEQSKKLAEFLPIESADQTWARVAIAGANLDVPEELQYRHNGDMPFQYYSGIGAPCWSLAALLGVLPILDNRSPVLSKTFDRKYRVVYHSTAYEKAIYTEDFDNPIDACYELVLKLHELKML